MLSLNPLVCWILPPTHMHALPLRSLQGKCKCSGSGKRRMACRQKQSIWSTDWQRCCVQYPDIQILLNSASWSCSLLKEIIKEKNLVEKKLFLYQAFSPQLGFYFYSCHHWGRLNDWSITKECLMKPLFYSEQTWADIVLASYILTLWIDTICTGLEAPPVGGQQQQQRRLCWWYFALTHGCYGNLKWFSCELFWTVAFRCCLHMKCWGKAGRLLWAYLRVLQTGWKREK